nr:hypothetical protein [Clostridia bacterium]
MKLKRFLSALLALLTVSSILASCGSGDSAGTSDTTAANTDNAAAETTTVAETAEYTDPGVKFDGRTFTALDYDTADYFWQAATYSDIFVEEENGDPINDAQYERNIKVEELLDVKLDIHSVATVSRTTSGKEFQRLVLAGEDIIDVGFMFTGEMKTVLADSSMSIDFADVPTMDLDASWWNHTFIDTFTIYDKVTAITGDISFYGNTAPLTIFFSKQLAEDYSLGNMYEMVRNRTWTADKMIEMCKKVANDLNGDGKMDIEDCYGMALQDGLINNMYRSSGGNYVERDGDEVMPAVNNERTISIIEKYVPFVSDSTINNNVKNFKGRYSNIFYELHIPMFKDNRILFNYNQLVIMFELRAMESDFGVIPWPLFDEIQEDYITDVSSSWDTAILIPATQTDLEFVGYVLDALGYYSKQLVTPAFIDTTVMNKAIRDDDSAEMLEIILDTRSYDIGYFYGWGGVSTMFTNLVASKSTDFASNYASIEAKFLSDIKT